MHSAAEPPAAQRDDSPMDVDQPSPLEQDQAPSGEFSLRGVSNCSFRTVSLPCFLLNEDVWRAFLLLYSHICSRWLTLEFNYSITWLDVCGFRKKKLKDLVCIQVRRPVISRSRRSGYPICPCWASSFYWTSCGTCWASVSKSWRSRTINTLFWVITKHCIFLTDKILQADINSH